jgi:hypothetical protein
MAQGKRALFYGPILGMLLGVVFAYSALAAPAGYAAAYDWLGVLVLSMLTFIIALAMLPFRRLRVYSCGAALCSATAVLVFWAFFLAGSHAGLRSWWGEEKVSTPARDYR